MSNPFTIAVIGCGDFARNFVPLFKAHPAVKKVYVCDKIASRAEEYQKLFDVEIIPSFEAALEDKTIDAVAIFVQRHLHGPIVKAALEAGKHVYSAVPMASTVEECGEIVELVKKTGLVYMMGETCIYYPCAMYCKKEYEKGTFGKFVYGESQYYHDLSHFPKDFNADRKAFAVPPFYYPTHSTAMLLWATGDHVKKVSAAGYRDTEENTPFAVGENYWDNLWSDEFSLMQLAGGGVARVNECRRIGFKAPSSSIQSFYGTRAGYQFSNAQHILTSLRPGGVDLRDVSDEVNPAAMTAARDLPDFKEKVANHSWQGNDPAPVQYEELKRLPESFAPYHSGHMYSHKFLVDDFCRAVEKRTLPRVNAWLAARFTVPGLIAHESVTLGGVLLDIPDFGDAPTR